MATGISLHFGVNNPGGDCCPGGTLRHAENAARQMAEIALTRKFESVHLYTGFMATAEALLAGLKDAATQLHRGDILLLTFSGHGCQISDNNPPEEDDGQDETWCMANRMVRDDELLEKWRDFREGVRIMVVAESCHSEGSPIQPIGALAGTVQPAASPLDSVPILGGTAPASGSCVTDPPLDDGVTASILLLASTPEGLTGEDGLFTAALLRVWNGGNFTGDYCRLHREVAAIVRLQQTPQITMRGRARPSFPHEQAFTI